MKKSFLGKRLRRRIAPYVPAACTVLLLCLALAPLRLPWLAEAAAAALPIAIYYWGLFRPAHLPYMLIFVLGFIYDVMAGLPPGFSSCLWLLLRAQVQTYGRVFAIGAFWGVWAGYGLASFITYLAGWLLLSYYHKAWLPPLGPALTWLAASVFYPLFHFLFTRIYKTFEPDRMLR